MFYLPLRRAAQAGRRGLTRPYVIGRRRGISGPSVGRLSDRIIHAGVNNHPTHFERRSKKSHRVHAFCLLLQAVRLHSERQNPEITAIFYPGIACFFRNFPAKKIQENPQNPLPCFRPFFPPYTPQLRSPSRGLNGRSGLPDRKMIRLPVSPLLRLTGLSNLSLVRQRLCAGCRITKRETERLSEHGSV